jgi:hypothetical protein
VGPSAGSAGSHSSTGSGSPATSASKGTAGAGESSAAGGGAGGEASGSGAGANSAGAGVSGAAGGAQSPPIALSESAEVSHGSLSLSALDVLLLVILFAGLAGIAVLIRRWSRQSP